MLAGLVALPVLVMLILSKWGVLIAVLLAALAALAMWVWRRGFLFIEVVAFLIHFDGVGAGQIRMGRIVSAVVFLVIAYKLLIERWRPPAVPTRHWLPLVLLILWATVSGAWVDKISGWFFAMGLMSVAMAIYVVSALLVDSHEKVMRYLRAFWVGGLFGSGAGVLALFLGTRSVGFGGDPNYFGLLQAAMIPLTVHYRRNETDPLKRHLYTLSLLFVLAGAAGAGSRSGLIGAAVAIVGTMVTRPGISAGRRARTAVAAVALAGVAFVVGFVANPNNLQRGFSDRGAGRLDFWTATVGLIAERPVLGHGFGQLQWKILPSLTTSPGVQELADPREKVSSHNTFLDTMGDLGVIGLAIYVSIFVVTFVGFLRPRWRRTKQISTTLFVMTLPIMTSAMFLPLLNNKLAWSMIGLSSALQVPSRATRWRGFVRDGVTPPPGTSAVAPTFAVDRVGIGPVPAVPERIVPQGDGPASDIDGAEEHRWTSVTLARWDVKVSRRFRFTLWAGALAGLVLFVAVGSVLPTRWIAAGDVLLMDMAATEGNDRVVIDATQNQMLDSIATSGAYARTLIDMAGLDMGIEQVRDRVVVTRKQFGSYMEVSFIDSDREVVERVRPHLIRALDEVIASTRRASARQLADELRPVFPGEQRYDTSPLYLHVSDHVSIEADRQSRAWLALIGTLTGFLTAGVFVLIQQRRPRVNNDDDIPSALGLAVWSHLGRPGRRYGATPEQYAQVATMASELFDREREPSRIVVTTPRPDPGSGRLAAGLAAAIAAEGRRVVLVDAQFDSSRLTARLSWPWRSGLLQVLEGASPSSLLVRVHRWRLPASVRRTLGGARGRLRFLPMGQRRRGRPPVIRPEALEELGPDVVLVVLAPSLCTDAPVATLLSWADAVVLSLVEGRTVTFDAEDAAAPIRTFVGGASGVVMLDV